MLGILELVLWALAMGCIGTVIAIQVDSFIYQHTANLPTFHEVERPAISDQSPIPPVPPGTPIARLTIPRLDLDVVVAEGSSTRVLRRAVGRLSHSARPGEAGNVVIAGHRDTFFRPLANVREGDLIVLDSNSGRHTYRVEWIRIVEPDDVTVLSRGSRGALTLVTCYPFQYVGSAPLRFVVRAREFMS